MGRMVQSEKETLSVHSSISTDLLNRALKKGAWLGGIGGLLLIWGGTLLPLALLKIWGIPLFCTGMACISTGLLPYRKLTRLQLKPHAIHSHGDEWIFLRSGRPLLKIPLCSLEKMTYIEKDKIYGLGLWLKCPIVEKVKVLQPYFNYATFTKQSRKKFEGCDLFLPYFSKRVAKALLEQDHAS